MKKSGRIVLSAALRGGAWAGIAGAGLLFPLDLSAQLDSLRMSLPPLAILANASFAWILYFMVPALAGALAAGIIAGVLLLFRRYDDRVIRLFGHVLVALLLAQLLVREAFRLASIDNEHLRWALIGITVIAFAAWLVARQGAILDRVGGFLSAVTTVCGIVAGVTIVSSLVVSRTHAEERIATANSSRPPVIVITIDSLAASRMSLYGYTRDTTPELNKFAQDAFVFDRHYTNSNFTTPSVESILSGTRPWVHRVFQLNARPLQFIAQRGLIPTLKRSGYHTMTVATNPYAGPELHRVADWVDRERFGKADRIDYKLVRRFPTFGSVLFFPTVDRGQHALDRILHRNDTSNLHFDPEAAFVQARSMLTARPRKNGAEFLWVHLFPPHEPYAAPPPFLRFFDPSDRALTVNESAAPVEFLAAEYPGFPGALSGRYDEAIKYVDYHIGQFLSWLKAEGWYDNSLIIIAADHGESLAHSYGMHAGPMLYEDLIHIPLLIKLPGQHTGSRVRDVVTEHADLLPTILDCVGVPVPGGLEGRSLRPVMEGGAVQPKPIFSMNFERNSVFGPLQDGTVALVDGRYKYVRHLGRVLYRDMPKLEDGLYDVVSDPGDNSNLITAKPDIAASMRAAIDTAVAEHSLPPRRN